jgi:hypothetical protein
LLNHHGVLLDGFDELDNSLFEVIDAKAKDLPIYFDFKNFAANTLDKFSYNATDRNFDTEINSKEFIQKIGAKYELLKKQSENPILYILNLHSEQKRKPDFFDENMKSVTYEKDSCIRIIPSSVIFKIYQYS